MRQLPRPFVYTILGLLVLATGAGAAVAPPLKNPGLESGLTGWKAMKTVAGTTIAVDTQRARGGKASLKLTASGNANPWVAQGVGEILPRATYLAAAFTHHESGAGRAAIKLEFYDAQNKYLRGYYGLEPEGGLADWNPLEVRGEAPENAAKAAIILRLVGPGSVNFDDVTFSLTLPPPALTLSPQRLVVAGPAGTPLNLTAQTAPRAKPEGQLQATLVGPGIAKPQPVTMTVTKGVNEQKYSLVVTLPAVQPGRYILRVGWPKLTPDAVDLVVLPSGQRPTDLDPAGRFLSDKQPFVPLGVYHATPADFPKVAEAGFTVAEIAPPANADELRAAVKAAQEAKLRLLVPLYGALDKPQSADAALIMAREFAADPTIFGWLLADQPELRAEREDALVATFLRLRQADPQHPALIAVGPEADPATWAPLCDALIVQLFPRAGESPTALANRIDQMDSAVRPTQPWLALVAAGWAGQPVPTIEEARALIYQALSGGAGGILWFSLREEGWDLTTTPLWADLPALNRQAQELGLALALGSDWGDLQVSVQGVTARGFRQGGVAYLILNNVTTSTLSGAVHLPQVVTDAKYLESGEEAPVKEAMVRFELPAGQGRVLRLTVAPADQQPPPTPKPAPSGPAEDVIP
ncbi:MAG TPA: hypothetical protein VGM19_10605 [Armatimonadota bacterium]|jgi:hypothetical protein